MVKSSRREEDLIKDTRFFDVKFLVHLGYICLIEPKISIA